MDEQIIEDYKNFLTMAQISKKYGIGREKISNILKQNNVHIRNHTENAVMKRNSFLSYEELIERVIYNYTIKGYGLKKSGEEFNLSPTLVKSILFEKEVPERIKTHETLQPNKG